MGIENIDIFMESASELGLSDIQLESLRVLVEDCFHNDNAKFLYVKEDTPYLFYTFSGLEDEYGKSRHLVNHFTYWLKNELENGYIKRFSSKEEIKQYILDNIDMFYSTLMYDSDTEPLTSIDDFKVSLSTSRDGIDDKIKVISNATSNELFSIGLVTKKSIFTNEYSVDYTERG